MVKKSLFIFAIFATISLFGKEEFSSERFIGIETGYGKVQSRNVIGVAHSTYGVEFGFRFGAQNRDWRTTISGHNFNKSEQKYFRGILSFDRFIWKSLYKSSDIEFKPYLGAHIGWLRYVDSKSNIEDSGSIYGGEVGIVWSVLNQFDFDFSYRYSISNIDKVDDIGSFVFALNYLY